MEELLQLLEELVLLHNRASAMGVDFTKFTDAAGQLINDKIDGDFKAEIAEITNAIRRPSSGAVN